MASKEPSPLGEGRAGVYRSATGSDDGGHPTPTPPQGEGGVGRKRLLFWTALVLTLVLDQAVKAWVRGNMVETQSIALWPNVFELRFAYNTGIAWGQLEGKGVLLTPVALAIAGAAVWYVARHPAESRWNHVAFGLLASGALGNLIDRIAVGKVTDMFYFRLINFPIFNVADACITVATIMLMIGWWRESAVKPTAATSG